MCGRCTGRRDADRFPSVHESASTSDRGDCNEFTGAALPSPPLPRPSLIRNQTFAGALGGAAADPVCSPQAQRGAKYDEEERREVNGSR